MTNDNVWAESAASSGVPTFPKDSLATDVPPDVQVTNVADVPPVPQPPAAISPEGFKGLPVRAEGDKVFLLKGGKRCWITSAEVFTKLGFKFGDEVKMDQATLNIIPEGEPIR